ncbi:DUF799 domain-containing protein [Neisseriaceae bacterium ESL0693]|nr:DUF799 domain-containing protein [Neisseriaceae bacterium ESL0693]
MPIRLLGFMVAALFLLSACQNMHSAKPYDYTALKESKPRSILVVKPTNSSVDVSAPASVLAQTTRPLSEAGYYVFPVALVNETFKSNGLTSGHDIQTVALDKLQQVYQPDAILYLDIADYGTKYQLINSQTTVNVHAKLIDGKTGTLLWQGQRSLTQNSQQNSSGILGMMISAAATQIQHKVSNHAYDVAGDVDNQLLSAGGTNQLLYGPYHPKYQLNQDAGQH